LAGTGLDISPDQSFVSTTVVTPGQLLSQPSSTLGDSLALRPGIAATTFAPGASRPVIRGLSGFRVRIQENGLATGDVSALSDDHAVPIDPLAAGQGRGGARPGDPALRLAGDRRCRQRRQQSHPDGDPQQRHLGRDARGFSTVDDGRNGAAIVEAGSGNFAVHADTFARSAGDYGIPGGTQANTSLESSGYALGGSYVFRDGFVGVAYTSFDSTYYIPGIEAAADKNHIALNQSKFASRGEWRVNDYGIEAIRFWFGATDYKHNEIDLLPVFSVGSTFLQTTYEARMETQHLPVKTSLGVLRGAVGLQWSDRDLQAAGADGVLISPTNTLSLAAFAFEELQLTKKLRFQVAGRIESDGVTGTASTFPPTFLPPPDDPTETPARRQFIPKSISAGFLYDLPHGITARSLPNTWSARPMPPSSSTKDRTTRRPPSRSATRT
jgi:iron complex outermembrane receptor protein